MVTIQRFKFSDIFEEKEGTLAPKRPINVSGISFGPGVSFSPGVSFAGVNFSKHKHLDIAAEESDGVLVIKGFFKD